VKFLPTLDFGGTTVSPLSGTANVALVRDIGSTETSESSFGYAPETWTGFYAGMALGHQMSSTKFAGDFEDVQWTFDGFGASSVTGGGFGGYLHQFGSIALDIEAGNYFNIGDLGAKFMSYGGFSVTANNYYGVRARAGVIVSPSTMIYGLAGWLHADGQIAVIEGDTPYPISSFTREGYEVGGGVETWIGKRWSLRADYSYATFTNGIADIPSDVVQSTSHVATGTVAAVFHFGQ
jgi:opacity protein-like surface antigen